MIKQYHFDNIILLSLKRMDIDDQLQMLQRQLMQVQEQKTNPLSERTIAEIMIKLHQQGFKFYPTTDGNQYIIPNKLDNQIIQFVQQRGRTKIGILPQILNLNQDLIQSRINQICQKSTHIRNNDVLLSKDYLRQFVHSLKQRLEIDGIVQLDQVALSQEFNMVFLMKIINQNLGQLDAEVIGNQLVTKQYRRMKKRRILGFLLAVSRPVNIQTLLKTVKLNDPNSEALIQQLIQEGKLKGRCQNSYYIPNKFSKNQKQMIQKFFQTNGYLDFVMLQKNFQVTKPEDWVKKNLKADYVIFEGVIFNNSKLEHYKSQVESLLKGQGFFQISHAIPFQLQDRKMEKFLHQICGVKDFVLDQGICYSQQWLNKCVNQFRDRVIYDIFFKKNQPKGKKKANKKQKQQNLTQIDVVETIFDAGLAQYSVAQSISNSLLPLILERISILKTQLQSQLNKTKGIISNAFLKYKKCKTIMKTPENLQRVLNTIQKQKKKSEGDWVDPDFGSNQNNPDGKFSLIYYDGILPPDWPALQNIKWVEIPIKQFINKDGGKSKPMAKSLLVNILEIIDNFNATIKQIPQISTPNINKIPLKIQQGQYEPSSPLSFKFFVSEKECRYVLVDNRIPFIGQEIVSSGGLYGLIQKAYAKMRYCFKALLGVGITQLILQLTGINPTKIPNENNKDQQKIIYQLMENHITRNNLIIVMGQGTYGKKIKLQGVQTQLTCMKPYRLFEIQGENQTFKLFPGDHIVQAKQIPKLFKNIYIVAAK